ncbi:MAG: hypothetical protein EOP85_00230 [Verrucomicrobiaceae bacterium]|nr:MAG: hypothetical protein EOP85_00230 [Verrucomicrobiaceae bacterium]
MKTLKSSLFFFLLACPVHAAVSIVVQPGSTAGTSWFTVTQTTDSPTLAVSGLSGYVMGMSIPSAMFNVPMLDPDHYTDIWGLFPTPLATVRDVYSGQALSLNQLRVASSPSGISVLGSQSILTIPTGHSSLRLEVISAGPVETDIPYDGLVPGYYTAYDVVFGEVAVTVVPEPSTAMFMSALSVSLLFRRKKGI